MRSAEVARPSTVKGAAALPPLAVMPVTALALAALVLGERVTPWQLGGCALVLLAVLAAAAPEALKARRSRPARPQRGAGL